LPEAELGGESSMRGGTMDEVLDFWLNEVGQSGWYKATAALNRKIEAQFMPVWEQAREGALSHWTATAPDPASQIQHRPRACAPRSPIPGRQHVIR
jgi:uncharacterized protein (DUF924 family)